MKISVVIPAFNEEKLLPATLAAVTASQKALLDLGWETETIVCDNNSTDATAAVARSAGATVVFEPVNQIARARNTGARAATGDWLVFVDADSQPSPELFADVAAVIQCGKCLGGGATIQMVSKVPWLRRLNPVWNCLSRTLRWAAGSFIFCERRAFQELGGFDEKLYVSEELDFSQRLKKLARRQRRTVEILTRNSLRTSDRKAHLYTFGDHLRFFLRIFYAGPGLYKKRENCGIWYDGKR